MNDIFENRQTQSDDGLIRRAKLEKKHAIKRRRKRRLLIFLLFIAAILLTIGAATKICRRHLKTSVKELADVKVPDYIDVDLISIDGASRSGTKLDGINDIVIHYVGNPGTTALQNRSYYENADSTVSSHFLIGLDGEIIQCVPLDERSAASNNRNHDTISIEVCHPDETGKFTDASYSSLVRLTAWLCDITRLDTAHIIRHYDVTGKMCPLYFVKNADEWENFKNDVAKARE